MTGPRWPRTCSHPIYGRTLTGVYQVVRMSSYYFHVIISIGILESNSLSLSTPSRTKWTLVYLLFCRLADKISVVYYLTIGIIIYNGLFRQVTLLHIL